MKNLFLFFIVLGQGLYAQQTKDERDVVNNLKKTIGYLSDDKLEGRRTGSKGEKLAYEFIQARFKEIGLTPIFNTDSYLQQFDVKDGKKIDPGTSLNFQKVPLTIKQDYFPLSFSGDVDKLIVSFQNIDNAGFSDLKTVLQENEANPHFDLRENIYNAAREAERKAKKLFFIFNSSALKDNIFFDPKDTLKRLGIPVIYLENAVLNKFRSSGNPVNITLTVKINDERRTGHNVAGYIDNKAKSTIILGAHLIIWVTVKITIHYISNVPEIHNGADDNASGIAALIELSKVLRGSALTRYNYLFVAFSGEELGLYGSKYFTEHSPVNLSSVNYMINMDMIGRLKDSAHSLTVGGFGTSPAWNDLIDRNNDYLKIKLDSSGVGPSDHTSFYRKNIPVLFFFTGSHIDYHKPSDDADKINYEGELSIIKYIFNLIKLTDAKDKLIFTKTSEGALMGKSSFKVTLGVMPDYSFTGNGVRIDGVSEGRAAQKAGLIAGDVLYQLGPHSFNDVQTYMQVLNKFEKGQATKVKVMRGKEKKEFDVVF
ncbi:MAG: M28 family peptidase [Ferruginibacter sp.]